MGLLKKEYLELEFWMILQIKFLESIASVVTAAKQLDPCRALVIYLNNL